MHAVEAPMDISVQLRAEPAAAAPMRVVNFQGDGREFGPPILFGYGFGGASCFSNFSDAELMQ